jgi:hypothetical protein
MNHVRRGKIQPPQMGKPRSRPRLRRLERPAGRRRSGKQSQRTKLPTFLRTSLSSRLPALLPPDYVRPDLPPPLPADRLLSLLPSQLPPFGLLPLLPPHLSADRLLSLLPSQLFPCGLQSRLSPLLFPDQLLPLLPPQYRHTRSAAPRRINRWRCSDFRRHQIVSLRLQPYTVNERRKSFGALLVVKTAPVFTQSCAAARFFALRQREMNLYTFFTSLLAKFSPKQSNIGLSLFNRSLIIKSIA